ncbi:alpha/beta-type small acid-soluble spore protein [Paenibacillus tarimensis]|uniref:alpha/beta-type small acid-soluble spore protein n=1 Tax=Paenibacillus tarimensis TaxID=416012 RepID=UPI001F480588|nr:alpha/beta-type small acid-soluble spore protein [Paenibacillus tarimensis]MCF2944140.1 alpha/beta-type small acid-soluble spore protein [Paenibacillus tarimensis]
MARNRNNLKVVPGCSQALDVMKYEIAAELGLTKGVTGDLSSEFAGELGSSPAAVYGEVDWPTIASRDAGAVGGMITRRLVQQAEQVLRGL